MATGLALRGSDEEEMNHVGVNATIRGMDTAVEIDGGSWSLPKIEAYDSNTGVRSHNDAYFEALNLLVQNSDIGVQAENSSFFLDNPTLIDNDIGLDLSVGSRGDVYRGYIKDNKISDIRYARNVLVGLFETIARSQSRLDGSPKDAQFVDRQWAASRILDTTDIQEQARYILQLGKKTTKWTGRLRLAVKLARVLHQL